MHSKYFVAAILQFLGYFVDSKLIFSQFPGILFKDGSCAEACAHA